MQLRATSPAATIKITTNFNPTQDVLTFTSPGGSGITGFYDAELGVLTLSGASTLANYETALRSVKYSNSSDNPTTGTRTISFVAYDVSIVPSVASTRTVSVAAVNDVPVITVPAAQTVGASDPLSIAAINANLIIASDVDSNAAQEQLTLTVSGGMLTLATLAGLTGSGNGTASLTYTGTLAALNAASMAWYLPLRPVPPRSRSMPRSTTWATPVVVEHKRATIRC